MGWWEPSKEGRFRRGKSGRRDSFRATVLTTKCVLYTVALDDVHVCHGLIGPCFEDDARLSMPHLVLRNVTEKQYLRRQVSTTLLEVKSVLG